jgi:hypothetical protein
MFGLFGRRKGEGLRLVVPPHKEIMDDLAAIGRVGPFAAASGLNLLANRAQEGIRDHVRGEFMLRRPQFVLNTIKREKGEDFANRNKLVAGVRVDPTRNQLAKFVEGGRKVPTSGRSLAVPVNAKRTAAGIIRKDQRPRALIGNKNVERFRLADGREVLARFSGRGKRGRVDILYRLVPSVPIRPSLPIYTIARDVFDREWLNAMQDGLMEAMLKEIGKR